MHQNHLDNIKPLAAVACFISCFIYTYHQIKGIETRNKTNNCTLLRITKGSGKPTQAFKRTK
uniref:Uncharacterized protein n=1 Tax=Rhizophora mucronata TaxID=61149 RepID=A0A2P2PJC7_RHIMU